MNLRLKSEDSFRTHLRTAGRAYFDGRWMFIDFVQEMNRLLAFHYTQAWTEGERAAGGSPEERTDKERQLLQSQVAQDMNSVNSLMTFIETQKAQSLSGAKSKAEAWSAVSRRLDLWANRYRAIANLAAVIVGADAKLQWVLGMTEQHCEDCSNYNGRIYRASAWRQAGAMPQSNELECGGYNCDCSLVPTRARATPGYPPAPTGG